jgi:hypothetical protein
MPDKSAVMAFLRELQLVLSQPEPAIVSPEVLLEFRKCWYKRCGYFAKEVEEVVRAEEMALKAAQESRPDVEEVDQAAEEEDEVSILTVSISVKKFYYIFIP